MLLKIPGCILCQSPKWQLLAMKLKTGAVEMAKKSSEAISFDGRKFQREKISFEL